MAELDESIDPRLDDEIAELDLALSLITMSAPVTAVICTELADKVRRRAERDGDSASLDESLRIADHALRILAPHDPNRGAALLERALTMEQRFHRSNEASDLDEAIRTWRLLADTAVAPPEAAKAEAFARLGGLLRIQLGVLVRTADDDTIAAALAETHRTLLTARGRLADDSPSLAETCWLLGLSWGDRYERERDPHHLDQAIAELRHCLRLASDPSGDRSHALAKALHERAVLRYDAGQLRQARQDVAASMDQIRDALATVDPADQFRVEVLWTAATIAINGLDVASEAVDLTELRAWADLLLAHYDDTDPDRATDEAQAADDMRARILVAILDAPGQG